VVAAAVTANFLVDSTARIEDAIFPVVYFGGAWTLGRFLQIRSSRVDELGDLAARLAAEQEQSARLAVSEERTRIARELHDIVAHGVSTIVLQAQGAEGLVDKDPERARRMLATIQETGRGSLVELRRLLGLLRTDGDDAELDPQPRIEALEGLVERLRAGGMDVSMNLDGDPSGLPAALQLSVFRIAQEALTNSLKYAGPVATSVDIKIGTRTVSVEVADEGKKQIGAMNGGHGLIGIEERVKLFGGDVTYGPRPQGGFAVRATIPVVGSET
jgi:signal transduction histidine kinase